LFFLSNAVGTAKESDSLGLTRALRVLLQYFLLGGAIVDHIPYAFRGRSEDLPQILTQNIYLIFRHYSPLNEICGKYR